VNNKKLALALAALLCLGSAAFAEVAVKDKGNGEVAITFTFKDSSSEMDVIGSFDNWTVPGEAMTKNAAGVWEKTITAAPTDEITYKFYSKGTWIPDENAPDHKDDGYGGKNGLIVVADILSGAVSATPGAAPVAVAPGIKKPAGRPKVAFGTQTFVESDTTFKTTGGSTDPQTSVVTAYSNWKFDGDLIAGMPGHFEITAFNGQSKILDNTSTPTLDANTGLQNLAGGVIFGPFYYFSGNNRPVIDKFAFGVDSPWVVYDTGYGNAPFPTHTSVLWNTTSGSLKAGQGYSSFRLGKDLKDWGDVSIDAGVVPNLSLNQYYGLSSWASLSAYGVRVEGQYDLASSTKTDPTQYFVTPIKQNTVLGAEAFLDAFYLQGQFLVTKYPAGTSGDALSAGEKSAYKAVVGYKDAYETTGLQLGYAFRGLGATLIYSGTADTDLMLGGTDTVTMSLNAFQKFDYWGDVGLDAAMVSPSANSTATNTVITVRPSFGLNLDKLDLAPVQLRFYAQGAKNSAPPSGTDALALNSAGTKVSLGEVVTGFIKGMDVYYQWNNLTQNDLLQTVLTEAKLVSDVTAQAGFGYRSGSAAATTTAFVLGASYQLPVPEAKLPRIYAQLVANMDPYNTANSPVNSTSANLSKKTAAFQGGPLRDRAAFDPAQYDLTDFGPTNGATAFDGQAALRVGIEWNF
jgi:hypothetical protein